MELLSEAEAELQEAYDWYEEQLTGLGDRLYKEVNYYLGLIESNPHRFAIKYQDELRTARLNKFPYLIMFWVDENGHNISILSIVHTSQNSKYRQ